MRSFLGVLMVLAVSAGNEVTINGFAGESVLLPCNCPGRIKSTDFHWQMDIPEVFVINQSYTGGRYKGRAKIFVDDTENLTNCSLLLINITANDTGKYRCRFDNGKKLYNPVFINLNVSGSSSVGSIRSFSDQPSCCIRFFKIIPIVLLLGFCLVL